MVVAQLEERSLPTPEIRGSNPDFGKVLSPNCTLEKTKIKEKRPGMAHLKKKMLSQKPRARRVKNYLSSENVI